MGDLTGDGIGDLAIGVGPLFSFQPRERAVLLLALDGLVRAGFEHGDDLDRTALPNGLAITPSRGYGRVLQIQASSSTGQGAAIFDSTPDGPNAFGTDPDLLVDRGNVLIVQEGSAPPSGGLFPFPNDAGGGGTFWMAFDGREVEAHSIDLVDICPGGGESALVVLTDALGFSRAYAVPSGFTEDVAAQGGAGWRTLDLRTLDPQPGFISTATGTEDLGFKPQRVVSVQVFLTGSGALDNLIYDPRN